MEIDPVVLQLRADLNSYLSQLRSTTANVEKMLGTQEAKARRLEAQMKSSSGAISGHLKSIAGALAAGMGAREIGNLADSFTRFTNQLRVAGLEGESLTATQEKLFGLAQKYGADLESVGTLYSRAAVNARELGASTSDLIGFTEAVSASLRISGTSAQEAQGALLQLGQALGSPRIQAEEFNSLIDTMQPLLREASKYIDGTGNSLAGLTRKIKDTNGSGVSNVEFFRAVNSALGSLQATAEKAAPTLGQAFTTLNNALGKYIGQADQTISATARIAQGIEVLADNLDTIIPAIALISTYLGVRYVAAAIAASASTGVMATATFALQARLAGAATSAEALQFAMAGLGLNPVALAVTALAGGFYLAAQRVDEVTGATSEYAAIEAKAASVRDRAVEAAQKLATATGEAAKAARENAAATKEEAEALVKNARAALFVAETKAMLADYNVRKHGLAPGPGSGAGAALMSVLGVGANVEYAQSNANLAAAKKAVGNAEAALAAFNTPSGGSTTAAATAGAGHSRAGRSMASAADQQALLDRIAMEELQERLDLATSAEDRAEIQREMLAKDKASRIAEIEADDRFTRAQKDAQIKALEKLYGTDSASGDIVVSPSLLGRRINRDEIAEKEREAQALADEQFNAQRDALQIQYDLAETQDERRRLALEMVDLEYRHQAAMLEAILASEAATEAEKKRAQIALDGLNATVQGRRTQAERSNEGPLARWSRENGNADTKSMAENAVVSEIEHVRDGIHSALSNMIGTKDPLINALLDMLIQNVLMKPIAQMLRNASAGGGVGSILGGLGNLLGIGGTPMIDVSPSVNNTLTPMNYGLSGRASGGRVNAGRMYRINEAGAPGRVEGFIPDQSGSIIPLGQMNALQQRAPAGGGQVIVKVVANDYFDAKVDQRATNVAAPMAIASASESSRETERRMMRRSRNRIP